MTTATTNHPSLGRAICVSLKLADAFHDAGNWSTVKGAVEHTNISTRKRQISTCTKFTNLSKSKRKMRPWAAVRSRWTWKAMFGEVENAKARSTAARRGRKQKQIYFLVNKTWSRTFRLLSLKMGAGVRPTNNARTPSLHRNSPENCQSRKKRELADKPVLTSRPACNTMA